MASVRDVLDGSPVAQATASLDLGAGRGVTLWRNTLDRLRYDRPLGHVFSLYLEGGTGTRRVDGAPQQGWPGAVCVFPEGQTSEWEITAPFRFVHLYLPDAGLRAAFAELHDCDARRLDLPEITFAKAPRLATPLRRLAAAAQSGDPLQGEAALAELVGGLGRREVVLKAGLTPHQLRRLDEAIAAAPDQPLRLAELSALLDLSPFHLHRMFKASRGLTLHGWITARRIKAARTLLRGPAPLAEIAFACGFSSQSHFSRSFKAQSGLTPAEWRRRARA